MEKLEKYRMISLVDPPYLPQKDTKNYIGINETKWQLLMKTSSGSNSGRSNETKSWKVSRDIENEIRISTFDLESAHGQI